MKQNLEQIKTKIYSLVPRLKEFSFGCELKSEYSAPHFFLYKNLKSEHLTKCGQQIHIFKTHQDLIRYGGEVIGHPITLEHVIEAVSKELENGYIPHGTYIMSQVIDLINCWSHGKTLDYQSGETITLIGNLLDV